MGNIVSVQCGDALAGRFWDCIAMKTQYISQLEDNLDALEAARDRLSLLKNDVMQTVIDQQRPHMEQTDQVAGWLSTVDHTIARVTELLTRGARERQKLCMAGCCSKNCVSTYKFGKSVAQSLARVSGLIAEADFKQVVVNAAAKLLESNIQALRRAKADLQALKEIKGRQWEMKKCWKRLAVFSIKLRWESLAYMVGGVGKTTLLILINNKFAINPNDFDVVIWVVVSKYLKPDKIQESIWKQIRSMDDLWQQKSFQEKAQDIFDVLQGKKFVLLLDDVWKQFNLEEIGIPLPTQQNGCKVVLTTRSLAVCKQTEATKTMKVKPLNWEEAWQLFKEKVGNINADVLHVAQQVTEECSGLPIALITIGCGMASRNTYKEWRTPSQVLKEAQDVVI